MELKGIAYMKTKPSVFAKEDDEYPPWLWTLLDKANVGEDKASLSCTFYGSEPLAGQAANIAQ